MDISNPTEVRNKIRASREKKNLAQEAVARLAGVSTWTVCQLEKTGSAKITTIAKVAEALGIPMQYGSSRRVS